MAETNSTQGSCRCSVCGRSSRQSDPAFEETFPRSPHVDRLLATNDPPHPSELAYMLDAVSTRTQRLGTLDERIKRGRDELELLVKERERIARDLDDYKAVSSPIRRLPAEILSEIFLACAFLEPLPSSPLRVHKALDVTKPPWVLIKVCSRWRRVGVTSPRLWSSINIRVDRDEVNGTRVHRSHGLSGKGLLLGIHLQRSSLHLLSIRLSQTNSIDQPLLQTIIPYSSRWLNVDLALRAEALNSLSSIRGSTESLQNLSIWQRGSYRNTNAFNAFEFAPQLRNVRLTSVNHVVDRILLPWSQLTLYCWDGGKGTTDRPNHAGALQRMPNLVELDLDCRNEPNIQSTTAVTLSKLRRVTLKERGLKNGGSVASLIAKLVLPAATHVSLNMHCPYYETDVFPTLVSLLTRSQCSLTSFVLHAPQLELSAGVILSLTEAAPLLETLNLAGVKVVLGLGNLLAPMTLYAGQDAPLLSSLEHLALPFLPPRDHPTFIEMVESRCRRRTVDPSGSSSSARSLLSVSMGINLTYELEESLRCRLEHCESEGLKVVRDEEKDDLEFVPGSELSD